MPSGNITSQSGGLRSVTKTFEDVDLFRGMLKLDNGNMAQYDFMQGGYAEFYWVTMPTFMQVGNPGLCTRWKNLTEKGATSFDGLNDMSANTEDITGGIAGNSFKQMTNLKDEFDSFTIKVYELQGSPIREGLEYWLTGIKDPKYGFATYHGLVNSIDGGYSAKNHSAELIYIVTDPAGFNGQIEYAAFITNIIPTKIPKSHLNMTHGDHPIVSFDLEFTGVKYESTWINEQAVAIAKKKRTLRHYLEYKPKNENSLASI